jgi:hypothetical protein
MTPEQARDLKTQLSAIGEELNALTTGMDAEALSRRPSDGRWSVAEILQHLILTAEAMESLAEKAIIGLEKSGARPSGPSGLGVIGWLLVKSLEPPPRMKTKTTKPFEPLPVSEPLTLTARLHEANARLDNLITRATGFDTGRAKVVSPFNERLKYNLYAAFRITLAHLRRHLWQARETKALN